MSLRSVRRHTTRRAGRASYLLDTRTQMIQGSLPETGLSQSEQNSTIDPTSTVVTRRAAHAQDSLLHDHSYVASAML